ncbi:MAG: hypothetical protein U0L26_05045 [Cellulosilyticum sp.]|nr:hypothetical protein [Cellulosilyticum sp.]MEE1071745.1 hypothetical protein [Cellulosilyticum sp.]
MDWLKKFMIGRYGTDQLSLTLLVLGLLLCMLTIPFNNWFIRVLPLIPIIVGYWRALSKNIYKRQQENFKFIRFYTPILKHWRTFIRRFKERKTHRYFKCPSCHQTLRVPKGKGNISITCPKCKNIFHGRS